MPKTNKAKTAFVARTTANILNKAKINPVLVKYAVQQNANARPTIQTTMIKTRDRTLLA